MRVFLSPVAAGGGFRRWLGGFGFGVLPNPAAPLIPYIARAASSSGQRTAAATASATPMESMTE